MAACTPTQRFRLAVSALTRIKRAAFGIDALDPEQHPLRSAGTDLAIGAIPGVGNAWWLGRGIEDAWRNYRKGNYWSAAGDLGGGVLGSIPIFGNMAGEALAAGRLGKTVMNTAKAWPKMTKLLTTGGMYAGPQLAGSAMQSMVGEGTPKYLTEPPTITPGLSGYGSAPPPSYNPALEPLSFNAWSGAGGAYGGNPMWYTGMRPGSGARPGGNPGMPMPGQKWFSGGGRSGTTGTGW